jgi:hypothetical protein
MTKHERKHERKHESTENSVNVALRDLMGLEDERQREEEDGRRRREEEERRRREEEARRRTLEDEARRRREEEARVARERERAEEEGRRQREEREGELRIRAKAEAAAMAERQARLLEVELEMRRVAAGGRRAPGWFWPVAAILVLGLFGASGASYAVVSSGAEDQVRDARRDLEEIERRAQERIGSATALADDAARRAEEAQEALAELRRVNEELREQNRRLEIATAPAGKRPVRQGASRPPVEGSGGDGLTGIVGCSDPLGCGGDLEGLPLDVGKKKKQR